MSFNPTLGAFTLPKGGAMHILFQRHFLLISFAVTFITPIVAREQNKITKLFLHQSMWGEKLVLRFQNKPAFNRVAARESTDKQKMQKLAFQFPFTTIDAPEMIEIRERLETLGKDKYKVQLQEVTLPIKGTKLTIEYDAQKVVCLCQECDSIQHLQDLVIELYDKSVLEKIATHDKGLLTVAFNQTPRIIIDPGHGGCDEGAVSSTGVKEKNVTLAVAKNVADLLKKKGYEVFLTRNHDTLVPLDKRTLFANTKQASLFVSIHANSAPSAQVSGLETYWCDSQSLLHPIADSHLCETVRSICSTKDTASQACAQAVHTTLLKRFSAHGLQDRKVKKAVTQVLLGSQMPSILIELGFLSHAQESEKLATSKYQLGMANGIVDGIDFFMHTQEKVR